MKIIIVGAGEVGFHVASRLALEKKDVVVVDKKVESLRRISENMDVQVIHGSGGSPIILKEAGVENADILLAVTDSDETNLVACLISDILSPTTKKLARIRDFDYDQYHETFRESAPHIDTIINPEMELVKSIERMMNVPGAVDIGEVANGKVKFVGIQLENNAKLAGTQLMDLPKKIEDRVLIAAIVRNEQLIIPRGDDYLMGGDLIYFISEEKQMNRMLHVFEKYSEPIKRVLIIGGGRVGFRLAERLEKTNISTKLIEKSPERCNELADMLEKTLVLQGDGSDQRLLNEENVADMDAVITVTNDEETNILTSLLIRRMGQSKIITRISKFSYFPLMKAIGMEQVVNSRLSAINSILQHIRRGKILSAISIKSEQAEVMEAVAMETSDIVNKPLMDIPFPKGTLVTAIIRDEKVIIPTGTSIIEPNDRIIIFSRRQDIPKVEKILSVKLEYF